MIKSYPTLQFNSSDHIIQYAHHTVEEHITDPGGARPRLEHKNSDGQRIKKTPFKTSRKLILVENTHIKQTLH